MVDNKQIITADSEEEFTQKLEAVWVDISRRAAQRAAETIIRTERWENSIKRLNQGLLAVAATLTLLFPLECIMAIQLQALASTYASSIVL